MAESKRTPVAIAIHEDKTVIVACDDGTVWVNLGHKGWKQDGSSIPGTRTAG